jgi:hypothetical protein
MDRWTPAASLKTRDYRRNIGHTYGLLERWADPRTSVTMAIISNRIIGGLAALALVGCSGARSNSEPADSGEPAASVCGSSVGHDRAAAIHVSRSTNSPAIDVAVFCDSSAERTLGTPGVTNAASVTPKVYAPGSPEVTAFLADLNAVGDLSAIPIRASCAKSISFGTTTTVSALGGSSGDLECLDSPSATETALANDCNTLAWEQ